MAMQRYANFGRNSNVLGFELGEGWIEVVFQDWSAYLYEASRAGAANIDKMRKLALQGRNLNAFINKNVRQKYSSKRCVEPDFGEDAGATSQQGV